MDLLFKKVITTYSTIVYSDNCEISIVRNDDDDLFGIFEEKNIRSSILNNRLFEFTDEKSFEEYKTNQLASTKTINRTLVIEKNDEKIAIKYFYSSFGREKFSKWFKKEKRLEFITYRFKDGAVFYGAITNYHKKRKFTKIMRRFAFGSKDIINEFRQIIKRFNSYGGKDEINFDELKPIRIFVNNIPGSEKYIHLTAREQFYRTYLDKNNVKYPDNFMLFVDINYPSFSKKELSKNGFKLIDTLMSLRGLKGGKIRKILHNLKKPYHDENYKIITDFYGNETILSQSDDFLVQLFNSNYNISSLPINHKLSKKELKNSLEIVKLVVGGLIDRYTFTDHCKFYNYLKNVEPIKWESINLNTFTEEHYLWSEKYSDYTLGNFERLYPEKFLSHIQKEITDFSTTFYPVVLTNSKMYNNESAVQNNCVRTYIKRPESVIISVREGGIDSNFRTTIEYIVSVNDKKELQLDRVQTRGKFNKELNEEIWGGVLSELDKRVHQAIKLNFFNQYGIKVIYNNGRIYETKQTLTPFVRNGHTDYRVTWENNDTFYDVKSYENEFDLNYLTFDF
jgi:hypothetical protein